MDHFEWTYTKKPRSEFLFIHEFFRVPEAAYFLSHQFKKNPI